MIENERVKRALNFATQKHKGQKRIGGADYITHPVAVCEEVKKQGYGEDFQITALFHDLFEDTNTTEQEILQYGNQNVLTAVKLLTKEKGYDMQKYIDDIKNNQIAFIVKSADRLHNLQCAHVAGVEFKRKYLFETVKWYLDFSDDIKIAVKKLAESLDSPIEELPFLYTPIESWKV